MWPVVELTWLSSSNHWKPHCKEMRSWKTKWRKASGRDMVEKIFDWFWISFPRNLVGESSVITERIVVALNDCDKCSNISCLNQVDVSFMSCCQRCLLFSRSTLTWPRQVSSSSWPRRWSRPSWKQIRTSWPSSGRTGWSLSPLSWKNQVHVELVALIWL